MTKSETKHQVLQTKLGALSAGVCSLVKPALCLCPKLSINQLPSSVQHIAHSKICLDTEVRDFFYTYLKDQRQALLKSCFSHNKKIFTT